MELIVLAALVVAVFAVVRAIGKRPLPATEGDWFVVFDVDAEAKVLSLWFYPIVGFERRDNFTYPITTRPNFTKDLVSAQPAKKVNDSVWGVSVRYGRWLRDGALFDESGNPEYQDTSNFADIVTNYMLGEFKLRFGTSVPAFYERQIQSAVERAKREP